MQGLGIQTIQNMSQAVETLSGGQRQAVAVARAAAFGSKVVVLDEPTAALGVKESGMVLDMVKQLRDKGLSIILISHNMPHVWEVADRIHIQRLGGRAGVITPQTHDMGEGVAIMTGAKAGRLERGPVVTGAVVVGYIPSPQGVAAFERAKDEAVLRGSRLVVVNTGQNGNSRDAELRHRRRTSTPSTPSSTRRGIDHDVVQQPTGGLAAAEEILRVAAEQDASLIVIGMRQRTPVGKLCLGSTSQQVLLEAPCPVLAVKESARSR